MPTYTYKCKVCQHTFDIRQRFSDDPLKACPECEELALRKVISSVGIVFKGSGFYVTDNRSNGSKDKKRATNGGTDEKGKESAETKSEKSTDKTPAKSADKPTPAKKATKTKS